MSDDFVLDGVSLVEERPLVQVQAANRDAIAQFQRELDDYYREMRRLNGMDPMTVFQKLSSFSARASEIRSQLFRIESRAAQSFRTQQIEPFLDECERQFKVHSRLQAIREMELRMVGPL